MKKFIALTIITAILAALTACGSGNEQNGERIPQEIVPVGHLAGEINILYVGWPQWGVNRDLRGVYARRFTTLHPDVVVNFEVFPFVQNMTQRLALTTRLMADPPDMLVFPSSSLIFEKMNVEAVFANLYDFFYGSRGINQDDYFCNIFRAVEISGGLYHLPLYVHFDFSVLNRRLFQGIGVNVAEIDSLTVGEEIDFFLRLAEAFPDEELFPYRNFSIMQILQRERLYDLDTLEVFVDTPEMFDLFERALLLPLNPEFITFTPEMLEERRTNVHPSEFLEPSQDMLRRMFAGLTDSHLFFMDYHPGMRFSTRPVLLAAGDERDVGIASPMSFAIMRDASNGDLAWEFLRFIMETDDDLVHIWVFDDVLNDYVPTLDRVFHPGVSTYETGHWRFPINRTRFERQVKSVLTLSHAQTMAQTGRRPDIPEDEHRRQTVTAAMDFLRDAMERITFEIRNDTAVMNSLVYPDIWLLYSGQQDIATTLSRIQNRLELYVHE